MVLALVEMTGRGGGTGAAVETGVDWHAWMVCDDKDTCSPPVPGTRRRPSKPWGCRSRRCRRRTSRSCGGRTRRLMREDNWTRSLTAEIASLLLGHPARDSERRSMGPRASGGLPSWRTGRSHGCKRSRRSRRPSKPPGLRSRRCRRRSWSWCAGATVARQQNCCQIAKAEFAQPDFVWLTRPRFGGSCS